MKQKESTRLSDYQRIVSYLYEYHHGIKGSNVGFAKIEKRQNRLRVYFHVKTNEQALEYKIYPRLFTAIPCEVAEIHVITVF